MWGPITLAIAALWSAFVLTYEAAWPGLVTVIAVVAFAFVMPLKERGAGVVIALAFLVNWALVQWTFASAPPQVALAEMGIKLSYIDLWAFFDALVGLAIIAVARKQIFGVPLLALVFAQEGLHDLHRRGWDYQSYRIWLDVTWLTMLAIIVIRGFPGARDAISTMVHTDFGFGLRLRARLGLAKEVKGQ